VIRLAGGNGLTQQYMEAFPRFARAFGGSAIQQFNMEPGAPRRPRHRERAYRMVVGGRIRARWCTGYRVARKHLIAAVLVGGERTLLKDAAFGMRQLVDIALKALSPAINDRTLQ
jgi:Predicted membrane protein (DUF2254)